MLIFCNLKWYLPDYQTSVYFSFWTTQLSVPTKREIIILVKVKSCNASLRMLPIYISIYLKSVLRYKFLILVSHHPDCVYLRELGCEDYWSCFEAKGGPWANNFGNHCCMYLLSHNVVYAYDVLTVRYGLDDPEIESRWGEIFRTHSDRPWGPPSLLYNGYHLRFSCVKRPWRGLNHPPPLSPRLKKE
jgi:hypothetical protein